MARAPVMFRVHALKRMFQRGRGSGLESSIPASAPAFQFSRPDPKPLGLRPRTGSAVAGPCSREQKARPCWLRMAARGTRSKTPPPMLCRVKASREDAKDAKFLSLFPSRSSRLRVRSDACHSGFHVAKLPPIMSANESTALSIRLSTLTRSKWIRLSSVLPAPARL